MRKQPKSTIGFRAISIFLATLMTFTSIPLTAFSAPLVTDEGQQYESNAVTFSLAPQARTTSFDDNWMFKLEASGNPAQLSYDDSAWRSLTLPHDWSIEQDFTSGMSGIGDLPGGTGWYRKHFTLPENYEGRRVNIDFDGVYMDSYIYVNGRLVGQYPNGYVPFSFDVTDYVICDGKTENVIAVKVSNITKSDMTSSRWYSGSGIYRDVHLTVTDPVHVAQYGTQIRTPDIETEYGKGAVTVNVNTAVKNQSAKAVSVAVRSTILNYEDGSVFAGAEPVTSQPVEIQANNKQDITQTIMAYNPSLWSVDAPDLYKIKTEILVNDAVVDTYETRFGFHWTSFDPNEGFSLNGEWMKLHGVCMHHDQGALGAVANEAAMKRQIEILQGMGVNAIRTSHNAADPDFIRMCDEMGVLVMEESFDALWSGKAAAGYERLYFDKACTHPDAQEGDTWAKFDYQQIVKKDRNYPSIIIWGIGNECGETNSKGSAARIAEIVDWVHEVDPDHWASMGENKIKQSWGNPENINECMDVLDAVGLNYGETLYDSLHQKYPDWLIYGSETSSAFRTRGYYSDMWHNGDFVEPTNNIWEGTPTAPVTNQCPANDNFKARYGMTATQSWIYDRDRKFVAGQFIWTGFDYIGEPSPYSGPAKSSYFGVIDTAGFPKDDYYLYQSAWTSKPMVHIMPHWNWEDDALRASVIYPTTKPQAGITYGNGPLKAEQIRNYDVAKDGGKIPMRVYSNAPSVELFVNGVSQGKKSYYQKETNYGFKYQQESDTSDRLYLEWPLKWEYKVGTTIEAVACDKNGNEISRDKVVTAGKAAKLGVTPEKSIINADGTDLCYIPVDVQDENGNINPNAMTEINFRISGNAEIVGVDNGNPLSHERYKDTNGVWKRQAFNGKALVIVRSTKAAGSFTLTASASGLNSGSATVYTRASDATESTIVGYEVPRVFTNINEQPQMPETVNAVHANGHKTPANVTWDTVNADKLAAPAELTLRGVVDGGTEIYAALIVKGATQVRPVSVVTAIGTVPKFPAKVEVLWSDGTSETKNVTWDTDGLDYSQAGEMTVTGTVDGYPTLQASAYVSVRSKSEVVISASANGGKVETDVSNNKSRYLIDDLWSSGEVWTAPIKNTTITDGLPQGDIELTLSESGTVARVKMYTWNSSYWRQDLTKLQIQYWDGSAWKGVSNVTKPSGFSTTWSSVDINFDPVITSKIKIHVVGDEKNKGGSGNQVAVAEIRLFDTASNETKNDKEAGGLTVSAATVSQNQNLAPNLIDGKWESVSNPWYAGVPAPSESDPTKEADALVTMKFDGIYDISKVLMYTWKSAYAKQDLTKLRIEYMDADTGEWKAVTNMTAPLSFPSTWSTAEVKFDQVTTNQLRFHVYAAAATGTESTSSFCIAEIQVLSMAAVGANTAKLSDLKINGTTVEGFAGDTYNYTYVVPYKDGVPVVTATAANSATYVVKQALNPYGTAEIEVTSQDSKTSTNYAIQFMRGGVNLDSVAFDDSVKDIITEDDVIDLKTICTMEDGFVLEKPAVIYTVEDQTGHAEVRNGKLYAYSRGTIKLEASLTYLAQTKTAEKTITIQPNTAEKKITAFDAITVKTQPTIAPTLPDTVTANYNTGLPRAVAVVWDEVDPAKYAARGKFTVKGTVDGTNLKPTATVEIVDILAAENIAQAVPVGYLADLPEKTTVYFSNGTSEKLNVTWDDTPSELNDVKIFSGTVTFNDTQYDVKASIRETDDITESMNYLGTLTGFTFPASMASYSNDSLGSLDSHTNLNDALIAFDLTGAKRSIWSNIGTKSTNGEDWAAAIMADADVITNKLVDTFEFGIIDEGKSSGMHIPKEYHVEYFNGDPKDYTSELKTANMVVIDGGHVADWKDSALNGPDNWTEVTYTGGQPVLTAADANKFVTVKFEPVRTSILRVRMTPEDGYSVGLNEIMGYGRQAVANDTASNIKIFLDGLDKTSSFEKKKLVVNLDPEDVLPTITATAEGNAAVTVIPATESNSVARIRIVPESGKETSIQEYTITFVRKNDPGIVTLPGTVLAAECNEDTTGKISEEGRLQAAEETVWSYPVLIAADGSYLFSLKGSSQNGAVVTLKIDDKKISTFTLGSEEKIYEMENPADITKGEKTMTISVNGGLASLYSVSGKLIDPKPGEATPSEATASFEADPKGWAYADQDSLDDLLNSDEIVTAEDAQTLENGGTINVKVKLSCKEASGGNSIVKKIFEIWGDPDKQQAGFLMENSLSKTVTKKNGEGKNYSLASASEAVKVTIAIPEKLQGMEEEDYQMLRYEINDNGEFTVSEVNVSWPSLNQMEFDAKVNGTYALAVPLFYTVTFKNYNGSILKEERVKVGNAAKVPEDPERKGYVFIGWDKEFNEVRKNMTVTAKYIKENTEGGVVDRLEGILESLDDLDPGDFMEIEGAVQTLIKRVNAVNYSKYTNDGAVMALLEEIENRMVELPGISSPYVDNKSQKISDASVNGALFGLEGKPGHLRIQDVLIPSKLPSGLRHIFNAIALDIKLFDESGINKPVKGLLKITMDLPETIDTEKEIVVIHYKDGSSEGSFCKYSLEGNQMVLVVDSLSTFTIANVNVGTEKPDRDSDDSDRDVVEKVSAGTWLKAEKGWWYRNPDGSWPKNSWEKISSQGTDFWYYFNEEGYMATGWLQDTDGQTYYLEEAEGQMEGTMAVGWKLIGGKWYYFNTASDGTMGALYRSKVTPEGYLVDENGIWVQ